jgi:hypothetical protein
VIDLSLLILSALENQFNIISPQGCWFLLSGLSAESEKGNSLCVLGVLSAAGGEIIKLTRKL